MKNWGLRQSIALLLSISLLLSGSSIAWSKESLVKASYKKSNDTASASDITALTDEETSEETKDKEEKISIASDISDLGADFDNTKTGSSSSEEPDSNQSISHNQGGEKSGKEILITMGAKKIPVVINASIDDNDALFAAYFDNLIEESYGQNDSSIADDDNYRTNRTNSLITLSGQDAIIYGRLEKWIKKVADGEVSSAVYTIKLSDLLDKTSYTAKELGVSSIFSGYYISEEASNAMFAKLNFDIGKIINRLLNVKSYDFYWYDKTKGVETSEVAFTASSDGTTETISFVDGANIEISFYVSADFSKTEKEGTNDVDITKTGAAKTAVTNAGKIVSDASSETDYDKLVYYREKICELTSYNDSAATDESTPFGNPWQLIYVFDGDTSTEVVCEGYSKAFQYLCDLSTFSNSVKSYTVTGGMDGGTGAGAHMWNIVRMPDGKNYIVDVTNCDEGSVGYPDKLFLAGASGSPKSGYTVTISSDDRIKYTYNYNVGGDLTTSQYEKEDLTLATSNYDPTTIPTPDGAPMLGDVNGDGKINRIDSTRLSRYIAHWSGYDETNVDMDAADINGDGKITRVDSTCLSRYIAHWAGYEQYFEG